MFSQISYNVVIDRFKAFADGHYLIRRFSHGQIDKTDLEKDQEFPWMHVVPTSVVPSAGQRAYSFDIVFTDLPREKEVNAEYQRESLSDCIRLAEDLLAEIRNGLTLFGSEVELTDTITMQPFIEEYTHVLTGVTLSCTLVVPWNWSACDIPANYAPGGSGSGGTGGGGNNLVLKVNGVNNVVQNILDLVEGTGINITDNGDGSVTFTNTGGGGGSVAWGSIVGTLANQVDLTTALNLKADISSLSLVATSGDYNDLINLPTIPAAQVNCDWNALSGVAEILNKPTIPAAQVNSDWNATSGVAEILNKPSGLPPTGAAGGDLNGTYPNPTVDGIHGIDMQSGTPTSGDVWVYGGSPAKWQHQMLHASQVDNDSAVTGTHVSDGLNHLSTTKVESNAAITPATATKISYDAKGLVTGSSALLAADLPSHTHTASQISDATTVGQNIVKLANPSAVSYLRINADNTATALTLSQLKTELGLSRTVLASDVSTTAVSTALVDVTGLTFPIVAGNTYKFTAYLVHTASVANVGLKWAVNADVAVSNITYRTLQNGGVVTGFFIHHANALNSASTNTGATLTNHINTIEGILVANNTGTAIIRFGKSQANAGTLTVKAGSYVEYEII